MKEQKKTTIMALLIVGIFLVGAGLVVLAKRFLFPSPGLVGSLDEQLLIQIPLADLPEDALFISHDRWEYDGGLRLIIPAIGVNTPVGTSTLPEGLRQMPGLYEFSQMPWETAGNVSIAGHRDIWDMVFYSLDKLGEGDNLYLMSGDDIYCYEFSEAQIVPPDDWSIIRRREFQSLTLTTCDPIGTTLRRLVVVSRFTEARPLGDLAELLALEAAAR